MNRCSAPVKILDNDKKVLLGLVADERFEPWLKALKRRTRERRQTRALLTTVFENTLETPYA